MQGRSTDRRHVGTYRRTIGASVERIWENALDWEHLPWLHRSSFTALTILEADRDMWRARVTVAGLASHSLVIELRTDRPSNTYVTRTLEGAGAGSEVHTRLERRTERSTLIEVDFHVAGPPRLLGAITGSIYKRLYARLWDEDEAMMRHRQDVLDAAATRRERRRGGEPVACSIDLGHEAVVRTSAPFTVETPRGPLRVVTLGAIAGSGTRVDDLAVHPTSCPHLGGPLGDVPVIDGAITCPWHGYRFDVRTGGAIGDHTCRFRDVPRIDVDPSTRAVRLVWNAISNE